ncbi:MAG: putative L-aspartate dehydrogenase [Firmicutes bacterium]|nr:putative L-aspartate dehydrogenase [Bacillota bacterium]
MVVKEGIKMKKIGFLGCGKIGKALLNYVIAIDDARVAFIQDPLFPAEEASCPVIRQTDSQFYRKADLIVECATADVLKANISTILDSCDLLMFSVTAFSDESFERQVLELCKRHGRHIYLPHGAILGLDGLCDARPLLREVRVTTTKNPKSLGLSDGKRTVVYEGPTRGACQKFPRNVNVHATVALAGIGFAKTFSRIISDPMVATNSHLIEAIGDGVQFSIQVESTAGEGVTGAFTPVSACASLDRVLEKKRAYLFV